ncbi:MAG: methionyl-tRNA formyltransferase [Gammaproteobacteria bacterium]|nr:methionyl-tRNA formyltransferase [Gammaproteobacteria bacterium]NIR81791.1 methionyl-tRNA formyltransferase [Gammaproteobacteria bacterium]NIR88623.1 methionyl-tRNA formyltransferase [Gammaproteobacteria bacterium]NIU02899.1 methionyl-tRNA formyltransferase [Gammaproteobacteria bacterium]NIV50420.1 methionyl-tRNA formyltransferase [Gammaproteobacteria bacterium]
MRDPLTIVFAGTPDFAAVQLSALLATEHRVAAVYTQPDRPAGRGRRVRESPVKRLARSRGIPVRQPLTLREPGVRAALAGSAPDVMVVAAYGLILPPDILGVPGYGCINVHASLLPRWRGAAPIQHAILAGDSETGVSIMQMDAGMDTGPLLRAASCPIHPDDTAGSLHERLAELGAKTLLATLEDLQAGRLQASPQDDELATYAPRIGKRDARIEWRQTAEVLERRVRAFNPWPVAQTTLGSMSLRIWRAAALEEPVPADALPGTVLACGHGGVDVATGHGILRLLTVQRPGGRPLPVSEFLNAQRVAAGTVLGD